MLTNSFSSTLGKIPYYDSEIGLAFAGYMGFCELSVTNIPSSTKFDTSWSWHRDIQTSIHRYRPDAPTYNVGGSNYFTGAPYTNTGGGNDTLKGADNTPDNNRHIFNADTPGYGISVLSLEVGTVIAFRFTAREWVQWNGAVASDPKKWHFFYTIKKTSTGWEEVGGETMNKFDEGENTSAFTLEDAEGL